MYSGMREGACPPGTPMHASGAPLPCINVKRLCTQMYAHWAPLCKMGILKSLEFSLGWSSSIHTDLYACIDLSQWCQVHGWCHMWLAHMLGCRECGQWHNSIPTHAFMRRQSHEPSSYYPTVTPVGLWRSSQWCNGTIAPACLKSTFFLEHMFPWSIILD